MRRIAVLGLGRFGLSLARSLAASGVEVIAADRNARLVDEARDVVTVAVQLDAADEEALQAQNIGDVDVCVVAIGEAFEAALLSTVFAKKLGVPTVITRAATGIRAEVLRHIGADEIIRPESEAGERLARRLANPQLEDLIELDQDHSIIQLRAPRPFYGRTLSQLALRQHYGVNLVAMKRQLRVRTNDEEETREQFIGVPAPDETIEEGDILVLLGKDTALDELPQE